MEYPTFMSHTFEIGALHTRAFRVSLAETDLPYEEHRGLFASFFVVKARTPEEIRMFRLFIAEARAWIARMEESRRQREDERLRVEQERQDRKLAKRLAWTNWFRKATFRKPLEAEKLTAHS